jgi:hypothetical protein
VSRGRRRATPASAKDLVINPNDFNSFYLLFDTYQLSSKNIDNLFKYYKDNDYEYQIEAIYPYINPLYEDKLSKVKEIIFGGNTLLSGINNFIITYINELNKNKLDGEVDRVNASGISIRMIKINTSNQSMFEFLKKYSNIKYNLSSTGIFKTF